MIVNTALLALLQHYCHKCEKVGEKACPLFGAKQPVHDIMEQCVDECEQEKAHSEEKPC